MTFLYKLKDKWFDFKMRCQRFKKGYADVDVWNVDSWFLNTLPSMLEQLKKESHGWPGGYITSDNHRVALIDHNENNKNEREMTPDDWSMILNNMIYLLKQGNEDTCDQKNEYEEALMNELEEYQKTHTLEETLNRDKTEIHKKWLTREEEINRYRKDCVNKALDIFKEWFWDL